VELNENLDLSVEYIKSLQEKIQAQDDDIYTFLKKEFPDHFLVERVISIAKIS